MNASHACHTPLAALESVVVYNRKRRHAALGYVSPAAYEEQHLQSTSQQAA